MSEWMYTVEEPRYVNGVQVGTILIDYVEWPECNTKILGAHALADSYYVTLIVDRQGVLVVDTMSKKTIMMGYHDKTSMLYWFPLGNMEGRRTERLTVCAFLPDVRAQAIGGPPYERQSVYKRNRRALPNEIHEFLSDSDIESGEEPMSREDRMRNAPDDFKQWFTYVAHAPEHNAEWAATAARTAPQRAAIATIQHVTTQPASVSTRTRAHTTANQIASCPKASTNPRKRRRHH